MDMKAYNQATAFFRKMELDDPSDPRWKKFADAMDEVAVLIEESPEWPEGMMDERCMTCQHYDEDQSEYHFCYACGMEYDCYKPMEEVERTPDDGYKKGTTNL